METVFDFDEWESTMNVSGTVGLVVTIYLALWCPLGVAFDRDNVAAISCPPMAVAVVELVLIVVVYSASCENKQVKLNEFVKFFRRWTLLSGLFCSVLTAAMFLWFSHYGFLAIMSFIGVGVSAIKNIIMCAVILIRMCISACARQT